MRRRGGFAEGIATGIPIGQGSVELTCYQFPEFEEFDRVSVDEEVEMGNLT